MLTTLSVRKRPLAALSGIFAALGFALIFLPTSRADEKTEPAKKVFCPVVGLPECKTCACPSGYCPLKVREKLTLSFKGAKIQFCCAECKEMFQKTPEKFSANANHQLVATGQAKQEKCPLCGGAPDASFSCEMGGVAVQFCSQECRQKAVDAKPTERVTLLFGEKPFEKAFRVVVEKK